MTREQRLRRLCEDILSILDRRDSVVLEQAAALGDRPAAKPAKPARPTSFVHEVAHGRIVMPLMPLDKAAEREKLLEYRRGMREDCTYAMDATAVQARIDFDRSERARYAAASEWLRRGKSDGEIIAMCGLFDAAELADIKQQIGM